MTPVGALCLATGAAGFPLCLEAESSRLPFAVRLWPNFWEALLGPPAVSPAPAPLAQTSQRPCEGPWEGRECRHGGRERVGAVSPLLA